MGLSPPKLKILATSLLNVKYHPHRCSVSPATAAKNLKVATLTELKTAGVINGFIYRPFVDIRWKSLQQLSSSRPQIDKDPTYQWPAHTTLYRWCTVEVRHSNMMNPRLKISHNSAARMRLFNWGSTDNFQQKNEHIWMSHERPCFICFVVWLTTKIRA